MPVITSVVPSTFGSGEAISITGESLGANGTVDIGGIIQTTGAWSSTQIGVPSVNVATLIPGPSSVRVRVTGS